MALAHSLARATFPSVTRVCLAVKKTIFSRHSEPMYVTVGPPASASSVALPISQLPSVQSTTPIDSDPQSAVRAPSSATALQQRQSSNFNHHSLRSFLLSPPPRIPHFPSPLRSDWAKFSMVKWSSCDPNPKCPPPTDCQRRACDHFLGDDDECS